MVQGGSRGEYDQLPTPADVTALALAQMRLSGAARIQTNLKRGAGGVPYSQRVA
jgi:hypothetical protein